MLAHGGGVQQCEWSQVLLSSSSQVSHSTLVIGARLFSLCIAFRGIFFNLKRFIDLYCTYYMHSQVCGSSKLVIWRVGRCPSVGNIRALCKGWMCKNSEWIIPTTLDTIIEHFLKYRAQFQAGSQQVVAVSSPCGECGIWWRWCFAKQKDV